MSSYWSPQLSLSLIYLLTSAKILLILAILFISFLVFLSGLVQVYFFISLKLREISLSKRAARCIGTGAVCGL